MSMVDLILADAKKYNVSITYAAKMAGVDRHSIYNARLCGRTEFEDMNPAERKHFLMIRQLCKKQERENQRIKRLYGNRR